MQFDTKTYQRYAAKKSKNSPLWKNTLYAFLVGGGICCIAQGLYFLYRAFSLSEEIARLMVSITLIFLAALFTGIGVFDRIAKFAGAGTLVPITGFANAVVAPAIDTKAEGFILGVGAKIFTIAGPVILYGTLSSVLYGIVFWIISLCGGGVIC